MINKKFVGVFNLWQRELERLGYVNFAKVLNAKDYGIPQNRERIFLISIRLDDLNETIKYNFPKPFPLETYLKDMFEPKVDERFYLSDSLIEKYFECNIEPKKE